MCTGPNSLKLYNMIFLLLEHGASVESVKGVIFLFFFLIFFFNLFYFFYFCFFLRFHWCKSYAYSPLFLFFRFSSHSHITFTHHIHTQLPDSSRALATLADVISKRMIKSEYHRWSVLKFAVYHGDKDLVQMVLKPSVRTVLPYSMDP